MKEYIIQYKPFLLFLSKFFTCYLAFTFFYNYYLNQFDYKNNEVDGFTEIVAKQSIKTLQLFDNHSYTKPNLKEPSVNVFYKNKWVSRVIEGCNALSIMILFISFVIAFSGKVKDTFLFIIFGLLIIHISNILRIALLSMAVYHYPQFQDFLHSVVFPLIIYGVVFLLWVIWVNKFSLHVKKYSKK